jgi:hypothetical protein
MLLAYYGRARFSTLNRSGLVSPFAAAYQRVCAVGGSKNKRREVDQKSDGFNALAL